ncbi:MAG: hypothetical protein QNJ13_10180 [Paracoccaceae bacterium]|nr:hypothetical protein [Paracoccaceae bacterium]
MRARAAALVLFPFVAASAGAACAADGKPLSAIDWLSRSIETPLEALPQATPDVSGEALAAPAPAPDRLPPRISARPLGPPEPETEGLVAAADLGLPDTLWGASTAEDVAARLRALSVDLPPNARDLLRRVVIVRQVSPAQGDDLDMLFKARVDTLLEMGALDEARLLLGARPPEDAELFRRWFDIALLTGADTEACRYLAERPDLSPTYPARIFCLARNGNWHVAALTLGTAESLGILSPEEDALLARFLDPELFDAVPPPPRRPSPLLFRLYEASGDRLPTAALPVAFAHADLAPILGWKARLEATERLARAGVVGPGALFEVYAERAAAASGGVWDRVRAVADLNARIEAGTAAPKDFARAFDAMERSGLGSVIAHGYRALPSDPGDDARVRRSLLRMAALQGRMSVPPAYIDPNSAEDQFLAAVVAGDPAAAPARTVLARAIRDGFIRQRIDGPLAALDEAGRSGEALFLALGWIGEAAAGDPDRLAEALVLLRRLGLEDTARRIAIDLLIEAERA